MRAFAQDDLKIHRLADPLYYYREESNIRLQKMLQAGRVCQDLFRRYGHLRCGRVGVQMEIAKSHCRSLAARFLAMTNQLHRLIERRNNAIEDSDMLDPINEEIRQIQQTHVPGLD